MSNHVAGNWFISVFKIRTMLVVDLEKVIANKNYRATTRRNALRELELRSFDWLD
jgi:hypothetical protein